MSTILGKIGFLSTHCYSTALVLGEPQLKWTTLGPTLIHPEIVPRVLTAPNQFPISEAPPSPRSGDPASCTRTFGISVKQYPNYSSHLLVYIGICRKIRIKKIHNCNMILRNVWSDTKTVIWNGTERCETWGLMRTLYKKHVKLHSCQISCIHWNSKLF